MTSNLYDHNSEQMIESIVEGNIDVFRSGALMSELPKADYQETPNNHLYVWGIDYVGGSGIIEKDLKRIPTNAEIENVITYFAKKHLPFIWWTSSKNLATKGFAYGGTFTGIALDISKELPETGATPKDVTIEIVSSDAQLETFIDLAAGAFGLNPDAAKGWKSINKTLLENGKQIHHLAYLHDKPVGTVSLSLSSNEAGLWNLSTLPEHRNCGIGSALVQAAIAQAHVHNRNRVITLSMPKGMAMGLFQKMGFSPVCEFPFYTYGISGEGLEK